MHHILCCLFRSEFVFIYSSNNDKGFSVSICHFFGECQVNSFFGMDQNDQAHKGHLCNLLYVEENRRIAL